MEYQERTQVLVFRDADRRDGSSSSNQSRCDQDGEGPRRLAPEEAVQETPPIKQRPPDHAPNSHKALRTLFSPI